MSIYSAALDTAPGAVGFALFCDEEPVISVSRTMRGRDASALSTFILEELDKAGVSLSDIKKWSVGSGPGSFTGLRQAAALVAGWSFARKDVLRRCVPGAISLASSAAPEENEKICCIYDGRNREILYYNILFKNGDYHDTAEFGVLNKEQAASFFGTSDAAKYVCFAGEYEAVAKIVPENIELIQSAGVCAGVLAKVRTIEFDNDLTRLVYIRPAVYPREN